MKKQIIRLLCKSFINATFRNVYTAPAMTQPGVLQIWSCCFIGFMGARGDWSPAAPSSPLLLSVDKGTGSIGGESIVNLSLSTSTFRSRGVSTLSNTVQESFQGIMTIKCLDFWSIPLLLLFRKLPNIWTRNKMVIMPAANPMHIQTITKVHIDNRRSILVRRCHQVPSLYKRHTKYCHFL